VGAAAEAVGSREAGGRGEVGGRALWWGEREAIERASSVGRAGIGATVRAPTWGTGMLVVAEELRGEDNTAVVSAEAASELVVAMAAKKAAEAERERCSLWPEESRLDEKGVATGEDADRFRATALSVGLKSRVSCWEDANRLGSCVCAS